MEKTALSLKSVGLKLSLAVLAIAALAGLWRLIGDGPNSGPEYDPAAVAWLEKIKGGQLNPNYSFLWAGADYSQWPGLSWSAEKPRRLRAIELPPKGRAAALGLGGPLIDFTAITDQPALERVAIKDLGDRAWPNPGDSPELIDFSGLPNLKRLTLRSMPVKIPDLKSLAGLKLQRTTTWKTSPGWPLWPSLKSWTCRATNWPT